MTRLQPFPFSESDSEAGNDTTRGSQATDDRSFWYTRHMQLRPTQEKILDYTGGRMAISAVPGSGKTFILSLLATKLLSEGFIDSASGQQVLVVTYMNASVETFRASIRKRLDELGIDPIGFEVRTLHSLALEIVRNAQGGTGGLLDNLLIIDETESNNFIALAVTNWIESNSQLWESLLRDSSPQERVRWQGRIERISKLFIRESKNYRYSAQEVLDQLLKDESGVSQPIQSLSQIAEDHIEYQTIEIPLLGMLSEIYSLYQTALTRQSAMDFDDLIWQASEFLRSDDESATVLRARWPYILEDEAQDSVPLQEHLLELITGADGNWVRVGDPNQAITSSFTTAHPKRLNEFLDRADVETLPLPHSGRNAPVIFEAANTLVDWVCTHHPVPEVRRNAFRPQEILPTPEGDAQPNPPNSEAAIKINVFGQRELEEVPSIAQMASQYAEQHADRTLAILVPTHNLGYEFARKLDDMGADYDNQLKSANKVKEIAASLTAILSLLATPLNKRAIADSYSALREIDHPEATSDQVDSDRIRTILLSIYKPESFLFALGEEELRRSLPNNVATELEQQFLLRFSTFLRSLFLLRSMAFDDLILTLSDELYLSENGDSNRWHVIDLAIAYQLAGAARSWLDIHPDWRLPEISAQLASVARGSHSVSVNTGDSLGFIPKPGRITLATQHGAKGMEWDAVFLVGIDGSWIPGDLDAPFHGIRMPSGGDPAAEAKSQLHLLMEGASGLFSGRSATESAHIEVICERLSLLYVGITRARRYLHISRSRRKLQFDKEVETAPATVMGILYRYARDHEAAAQTT